jgi:CheY-like chemotaxis protein
MHRSKGNFAQIVFSGSGIGFDPETRGREDAQHGFGLFSRRGRLNLIGGQLEIDSAPPRSVAAPMARAKPRGGMMRAGRRIRVLIADDHAILRRGLMRLLQGHKGIVVFGEAAEGREALEPARRVHPDGIIMEANMPRLDGIEATSRLKEEFPQIKVMGLASGEELQQGAAMCRAGAFVSFNKANRLESLVAAIRDSFAGAA